MVLLAEHHEGCYDNLNYTLQTHQMPPAKPRYIIVHINGSRQIYVGKCLEFKKLSPLTYLRMNWDMPAII